MELFFFNPCPVLYVPCPVLHNPFPVNKLPNHDTPNVPNNVLKNPPFCSFVSFLIVLLFLLIIYHVLLML